DQFAPFAGGTGEKSLARIHFRSVADTVGDWVRADECTQKPDVTALPVAPGDAMRVRRGADTAAKGGAEVVLYVVEGGGHTWPGREARAHFLGPSTTSVSANDRMWEFFEKHPR